MVEACRCECGGAECGSCCGGQPSSVIGALRYAAVATKSALQLFMCRLHNLETIEHNFSICIHGCHRIFSVELMLISYTLVLYCMLYLVTVVVFHIIYGSLLHFYISFLDIIIFTYCREKAFVLCKMSFESVHRLSC